MIKYLSNVFQIFEYFNIFAEIVNASYAEHICTLIHVNRKNAIIHHTVLFLEFIYVLSSIIYEFIKTEVQKGKRRKTIKSENQFV